MIVQPLQQSLVIVPQLPHDDRSIGHRAYDPYYFEHDVGVVAFGERLIEYARQRSIKLFDLRDQNEI